MPENDGVLKPVGRDLPGLGQCRFRELRRAIDVDEIGLHDADDFAGSRVGSYQRTECFGSPRSATTSRPPRLPTSPGKTSILLSWIFVGG